MKVFVTGGTGFIGANVVRAHLARGDEVRCMVRPGSPTMALDGLPIERAEVSLEDPEGLQCALAGCDGVQHVAGLFDAGPGGPKRMHEVHVTGTENLCRAAAGSGIRRFVLCSSSITIGFGSSSQPGDEDSPIPDRAHLYPPGTPLGAYFDTKVAAEAIACSWVARGLDTMIVNPDFVIGPWDIKPTSGALILTMARNHVPVYPRGGKCFIDAGDCAQGHLLALDRGQPGRRYLLGTENHSYRAFMAMVAGVVGRRPPWLPLPRTATRLLGVGGALLAPVAPHRAAGLDRRVLDSMQQERYRSGRRAAVELGLPHTPLAESIQAAHAWFQAHGYLGARR